MDSKQIVLIGIVTTSFLTALILGGILPTLAIALIILVSGLIATYHIALSMRRGEEILKLRELIKAGNKVWQEESIAGVTEQVRLQAQKIIKSEKTYLQLPLANLNPVEEDEQLKGLKEVNNIIIDSRKSMIINKGSESDLTKYLPANITSLIGVPLKGKEQILGVLYQMNKLGNTPFSENDQHILETIAEGVALILERILTLQEKNTLYKLIIEALVNAIDGLDPIMKGHSWRVKEIAILIGQKLGLSDAEMQVLEHSAILHDIGYLSPDSAQDAKQHPVIGAKMLPSTGLLKEVKQAILYHHERYNGSGYPEGLLRDKIPFISRIIAVADMYDAIIRLNCADEEAAHSQAVREIKKATGSIFDPLIVVAFEEVEKEINALIKA